MICIPLHFQSILIYTSKFCYRKNPSTTLHFFFLLKKNRCYTYKDAYWHIEPGFCSVYPKVPLVIVELFHRLPNLILFHFHLLFLPSGL
jgi:hypothetical protein